MPALSLVSSDEKAEAPEATDVLVRPVRGDVDALHAEFLHAAHRTSQLAADLESDDSHAAGGHARAAVGHLWRAAEELHLAYHSAPPRHAGPAAPLARLCTRRMRYLVARAARRGA
ncbi:DUF6238 family protein [Streptomyces sp. NPDC048442]|uniref:DUF6238 family protein n=1 Tax=Streptomyces sp. NPDC048442 TaxID=3154823 RepID=UPI0034233A6A